MRKLDISGIVSQHFRTLRRFESDRISKTDVFTFYGAPGCISATLYYFNVCLIHDAYNVSITVFGIFIALLLNVQVAIFAVFQRSWSLPEDERSMEMMIEKNGLKRILLSELNTNISYLILVSCFGLIIFIIFYSFDFSRRISSAFTIFIYVHFMLSLLMVIKRAHALFQLEYDMD